MMKQTVFIVEDDLVIRDLLLGLMQSIGMDTEIYQNAEEFMANYAATAGCLILDVRLQGMSGLRLQELLLERSDRIPIIFITGHGDIPMVARAMKNGAIDFFTKPFNNQLLLDAVQRALKQSLAQHKQQLEMKSIKERIKSLTTREQEVMDGIVHGKINRLIAQDLQISINTVEIHRSKVMSKMQVDSLAELIKLLLQNKAISVLA